MTFAGLPYTRTPRISAGADVAIVGAPMDDLTSDRPGTRYGPRAIRAASVVSGPHLEAGVDALRDVLRVLDFGDAPVLPADPVRSHAAIEATVGEVLAAGAIPVVLGGDHSIAEPDIRACADVHGPVGLIHFDAHTDTGARCSGVELSHGTPMYRLVNRAPSTQPATSRSACAATGPARPSSRGSASAASARCSLHDIRDRGIRDVVAEAIAAVGTGPTFLSVDVDVLDPAYAPGTGTPEPGGMTSIDLLWACREIVRSVALVGMDVVEVLPEHIGSRDITRARGGPDRARDAHRPGSAAG